MTTDALLTTILRPTIYNILKVFYASRNKPEYLREIARKANLNPSNAQRQLNELASKDILSTRKDGNRKVFQLHKEIIFSLFPAFDAQRLGKLPLTRKNAIKLYREKVFFPLLFTGMVIVFGSTAKGTYTKNSDIDILVVKNKSIPQEDKIRKEIEAQTGIHLQPIIVTEKQFNDALSTKDPVVLDAINTGFPVWGHHYFYKVICNE